MEEFELLEESENPYSRQRAVALLSELFGVYQNEKDGQLRFPRENRKEVADLILTRENIFSNWLKPDVGSYKTLIERLEQYRELTQLREQFRMTVQENVTLQQEKKTQSHFFPLKEKLLFVLAGMALSYIIVQWIYPTIISQNEGIYTTALFESVYTHVEFIDQRSMAEAVVKENERNNKLWEANKKNFGVDTLTLADSIQLLTDIMKKVENIIRQNRNDIRSQNFMVKGKKNLIDFVEFILPSNSLFQCSAEELAKNSQSSCAKSSPLDKVLFVVRDHLFRRNADSYDIRKTIEYTFYDAQEYIKEINVELFECYMKYGEPCFKDKGLNFECYIERGDSCIGLK